MHTSSLIEKVGLWGCWGLFFFATVVGHVVMKLANTASKGSSFWQVLIHPWAFLGYFLWGVSSLLWIFLLSKSPLLQASSIAALRYLFLCFSAVFLLKETWTLQQGVGVFFIAIGVYFVSRV